MKKKDVVESKIRIALVGNPNVGKSVVFNNLTGAHQHVGNWPGVTVEKKEGLCKYEDTEIEIVDLPGIYSLTASSIDEIIARNFIINEKPDIVVDIVDASNLERNLYLTLQLLELGVPVIVLLNMIDIAEEKGIKIDVEKLRELLGMPVIKAIAPKRIGMRELCQEIVKAKREKLGYKTTFRYSESLEKGIEKVISILKNYVELSKYNLRWLAIKLLEDDDEVNKLVENTVKNHEKLFLEVQKVKSELEKEYEDLIVTFADERYRIISQIVSQVITKTREEELIFTDMLDEVFTHKFLGIPIFLVLMWSVFQFTFVVAAPISDFLDMVFSNLSEIVAASIKPEWLGALLGEGIIAGLGFVLVFAPNIFLMFMALSILEDSGYLARAAFIMDKIMYKLGLHGKSFIPLLVGFGCNVPAIMATRTIDDEKDRLITILVNPLISCSARLPVYVLFAGIFFPAYAGDIIFSLYLLGIVLAILVALILRKTLFPGKPSHFIMEMPPYMIPTLNGVIIHMWERASMFIKKAGTIIIAGLTTIWILSNIPPGASIENSLIGQFGKILEPIFAPFGWDWRIAVALFFGFIAKEIVIGSLAILYGVGEESLYGPISTALTPLSALALMVFVLIYVPCIATLAVIKQETGSWKWTLFAVTYELLLAYIVAGIVILIGSIIGFA
ncbi:MAG: ferrous iron transport protein B [Candidatus Asgardarchaeia archaeon]